MSVQQKDKSFFSTTAGAITGAAGVLTAVVGILGAATQLGWIGSKDDAKETPTTTAGPATTVNPGLGALTTLPALPGGTTGTGPAATSPSQISVTPTSVKFGTLDAPDTVVRAKNDGRTSASLSLSVSGVNASSFKATPVDASCSNLLPGQSCDIKVTFAPAAAGEYQAKLEIRAAGTVREVPLQGSKLL
ncbi:MAG: hypothetical protein ACRD12_02950 [Acidimicrobiales bacterium]